MSYISEQIIILVQYSVVLAFQDAICATRWTERKQASRSELLGKGPLKSAAKGPITTRQGFKDRSDKDQCMQLRPSPAALFVAKR